MPAPEALPKLGILAGGGDLPLKVADACRSSHREFLILGLEGQAGGEIEAYPHVWTNIASPEKTFRLLKEAGCKEVVLAGKVARPDFKRIKPDRRGALLLPRVISAALKGDGALLSLIVDTFEREGFKVVGVHDVFTGLLASQRVMTKTVPTARDEADIARAVEVVNAVGALDIGQGAVVCEGLVLAVEAAEGTDAMLVRCAELPAQLRGSAQARRGVLVKLPKPAQEMRVDLPTIGVPTIERAAAAGLAGIAVKAGAALIIDEPAVIARADELGLFVVGIEAGGAALPGPSR